MAALFIALSAAITCTFWYVVIVGVGAVFGNTAAIIVAVVVAVPTIGALMGIAVSHAIR